ncbi:hypothetical protein Tco_0174954 [Tanacetum coccineum]
MLEPTSNKLMVGDLCDSIRIKLVTTGKKQCELKDEALRNKAIMKGSIKDGDDEEELCEVHEPSVCTIQRFEMIKYSFGQGEEYVAIKEDEYDDLARTSNNACRTYQEIFRMMDEGWMVTRAE